MADSSRDEIAKLEALYASNPAGRVFTHLAEAYRKAGELDRARATLEEGLQKHPDYASAHVVLGRVLMDQGAPDDSAAAFRRVLEIDPHNLVALRALGDLARQGGRPDEALRYFEELAQHDPGDEEIERIVRELRSPPRADDVVHYTPVEETGPGFQSTGEPFAQEATGEAGWHEWTPPGLEPEFEHDEEPSAPASAGADGDDGPWQATTDEADFHLGWLEQARESPHEEESEPASFGQLESHFTSANETVWDAPAAELGDLDAIGAAGQGFEIEGEAFRAEDIDLGIQGEDAPASEQPAATPDDVVVTETIAELYRRQGLLDRAADVYRTLLAQRPGDAALAAKLAEVEAEERGTVAPDVTTAASPDREPWEPEPASEEEEDSEQAAAWLAGSAATAESLPTPYAWTDDGPDATDDGGRPIRAYFDALLAWLPAATLPVSAPSDAATAGEVFDEWFGAPETAESTSPAAEPPPSPEPPRDPPDDDDDLEMFRSWLQSLKK